VKKPVRRAAAPKATAAPKPTASRKAPAAKVPVRTEHPVTLERERRRLSDDERMESDRAAAPDERLVASARAGHDELRSEISRHTAASPVLTAGDVDAKWQDAYSVGDEAPGGDNPTPDQDRVDDIGKALGVQYQDDQELQGGDEIVERDKHRWELDPASSDDWPHDKKS